MAKFDQIEVRFNQNEARFNQIEARFNQNEAVNEARHTQLLQSIVAINSNIEMISTRLDATQWNTNARFANFTANDLNSPLFPLHHYQTNEEIPNFPAILGDIQQLNSKSYPIPNRHPNTP